MKNVSNVVFFNYKIGEEVLFKGINYKIVGRMETSTENWSEEDRKKLGPITKFYIIRRPNPKGEPLFVFEQAFENDLQPVEEVKK